MESLVDPSECLPSLSLSPRGASTVATATYLLTQYPDLQLFKHPHKSGEIAFASDKAVNGMEKPEFRVRNAGPVQILEVWLYSVNEGHQVYGKPPFYEIGRSNQEGFGYIEVPGAIDMLDGLGLRFSTRKAIRRFMDSKAAIPY